MERIGTCRRLGVVIGGSGLIGGTLTHYFQTRVDGIEVLAPNSKKLSLREPGDIERYFLRHRPDFIINCAIAAIDANPQLAYEVNVQGAVDLARVALALKIPYIHFSSAAVMPTGEELGEDETLPLSAELANYPKSKLLAEKALAHLGRSEGLDYTVIRLGIVYGKHDHKIQGIHRLLFSLMDRAMPVLLTRPGVRHSYSHTKKIAPFVHHVLDNRQEFSRRTYNFVDPEPVELARLILTIRDILGLRVPRRIFLPRPVAVFGRRVIQGLVRGMTRMGIEARMPGELMFLDHFYQTQTLSCRRLVASSFRDPLPGVTIFRLLPDLIEYYLTRWEQLNLISGYNPDYFAPGTRSELFVRDPEQLLDMLRRETCSPFNECSLERQSDRTGASGKGNAHSCKVR